MNPNGLNLLRTTRRKKIPSVMELKIDGYSGHVSHAVKKLFFKQTKIKFLTALDLIKGLTQRFHVHQFLLYNLIYVPGPWICHYQGSKEQRIPILFL